MRTILSLVSEYEDYLKHERRVAPSTVVAYLSDLKQLGQAITQDVADIKLNDLRTYQSSLGKRGFKNATITRKFDGFRTFWKWMQMEKYVDDNIPELIRLPRRNRRVPKWLSEADLTRFANTPIEPYRAYSDPLREGLAWKTFAWLGLRRAELLNLRIRDVQLEDGTLTIRHSKGDRDRVLPLPDALKPGYQALVAGRAPEDYVFVGYRSPKWSVHSLMRAFQRHLKTCGLDNRDVTPHTIRHSFATHLARKGVPLPVIKTLLGHADVKTTMVYVHVGQEDLERAIAQHVLNSASRDL